MFNLRTNFATNDELQRQSEIQNVILMGNRPTTYCEKKAAAIYGSPYVNSILNAKVKKSLDHILTLVDYDTIEMCAEAKFKTQILEYLKTVSLDIGDYIQLPSKLPILSLQPQIIPEYKTQLSTITRNVSSLVNIVEFEQFVFGNRTKYRYLVGTSFASYVYQNILYSLNARTADELLNNNSWQAKLALLISRTGFNDYVAFAAFYDDHVQYNGVTYETDFVPKYDVKNLMHHEVIPVAATDRALVKYYNTLNVRKIRKIPQDKMSIFLTFPFKDGHVIRPDGSLVPISMYCDLKKSVRIAISELCNVSDIEFAIESASRSLLLDDVVYYALYAKNLNELAIALLIIRRMVGDSLTVEGMHIRVPSEMNILSWVRLNCNMSVVTLPNTYKSKDSPHYIALIQDIAQSCYSRLGATLICSSYHLPEIHMSEVYDALQSDAEKFVFYTLILQEYNYSMYYVARKNLSPKFGQSTVDMTKYPRFTSNSRFDNTTLSDRLDALTEPLVKPNDVNSNITICPPYKCIELYEFADMQLNELAASGTTDLNDIQMARYITLLIT